MGIVRFPLCVSEALSAKVTLAVDTHFGFPGSLTIPLPARGIVSPCAVIPSMAPVGDCIVVSVSVVDPLSLPSDVVLLPPSSTCVEYFKQKCSACPWYL